MKLQTLLSAFVISALMSLGVQAWAHDHGDGDNWDEDGHEQGENCQGGDIDGSETLIATVTLVATTNAPADAGGVAKLISENEDGIVSSSFSLSITGLTAGTYDLSVVRKSDGSSVDLGEIVIGCRHGEHDEDEDENDDEDCDDDCQWAVFLDAGNVQLPSDLDPLDIAQILISDRDGNVLLVGDLVDPAPTSKIKFKAKLRLRAASGNVANNGKALAFTSAAKGKRADRFTMIASGLAVNSTYSVTVNGQNAGTVVSNRKGMALIKKLPANLLLVKSVHLKDASGDTKVRAKF